MISKKLHKNLQTTLILLMLNATGLCQNNTAVPAATTTPATPPNRYQLNGPIVDTYQSPFLYVYGTISPNPYENGVIEKVAQDVVDRWKLLRNRIVPLKKDVDVTEADIQKYHLILYGNERSNKILKQIGPEMPIRFTEDAIIVGDRSYKNYDYGAIFVHPNPLNPAKYVLIYGALSYHGFPDINAVKASETDYVIFNEMSKMTISNVNAKPVEAGYFDKSDPSHWKVKPTPKSQPKLEEETSYQPVPTTPIKAAPRKPAGGKSGTK